MSQNSPDFEFDPSASEQFGVQGCFNISDPGGFPGWTRDKFLTPQQLKTLARKLLAYLRQADSPKSKKELAPAVYRRAFDSAYRSASVPYFDGYRCIDSAVESEKRYVAKTGAIIRIIHRQIRDDLSLLEGEEEKLSYLKQVALPIPIAEGDDGEALYVYHGPDLPQPISVLRDYIEWAENHQTKQNQPLELALKLYTAMQRNHVTPQLDTSFETPDEEMDQELDDLEENM